MHLLTKRCINFPYYFFFKEILKNCICFSDRELLGGFRDDVVVKLNEGVFGKAVWDPYQFNLRNNYQLKKLSEWSNYLELKLSGKQCTWL